MKAECSATRELIWQIACGEGGVPDEVIRHVSECRACACAVSEAKRTLAIVRHAADVPNAPDCRAAVAAHISTTRRLQRRLVWVYASAVPALILLAIAGVFVIRGVDSSGPQSVHTRDEPLSPLARSLDLPGPSGRAEQGGHSQEVVAGRPAVERRSKLSDSLAVAHSGRVTRDRRLAHVRTPGQDTKARQVSQDPSEEKVPETGGNSERPVVLVLVSWKATPDDLPDSFSCTVRDAETGEATICSGERTGDSVTLRMEAVGLEDEVLEQGGVQDDTEEQTDMHD